MNLNKNIFSFPMGGNVKKFSLGSFCLLTPAYSGVNKQKTPKGKLFHISTRICGKTENFQDFIRLEKSVACYKIYLKIMEFIKMLRR